VNHAVSVLSSFFLPSLRTAAYIPVFYFIITNILGFCNSVGKKGHLIRRYCLYGNNSSGLLLYLIQRRKYPLKAIDGEQLQLMEKRKKSAGIGLAFMAVGAIGFVLCLGALIT
jgi:hypothetical protein